MNNGPNITDHSRIASCKSLPISGSDLCLLALSVSLCGLWLLFLSPPKSDTFAKMDSNREYCEASFVKPAARYVKVEFSSDKKDFLLGQNTSDNDLVNDKFPLQTTLPLPSSPFPSIIGLSTDLTPSQLEIPRQDSYCTTCTSVPDLPPLPDHPYAKTFPVIANPSPVIFVSQQLQDAGFSFSQPTNSFSPHFSFSADISFNNNGQVQLLLIDTQVPDSEFLPWQNALMLSSTTNSASGKISFR